MLLLSISVHAVIFADYPEKLNSVVKRLRNSTDITPPLLSTTHIPEYLSANSTFIFQISSIDPESGLHSLYGNIINLDNLKFNKLELFNDGMHNDGLANDNSYSSILETNSLNTNNNIIFLTAIDNAGNKAVLIKAIKEVVSPKKCNQLVYNGDPNNKLDVVFLGNKFTNLEDLANTVKLHYENLFSFEPLKTAWKDKKINIHMINESLDLYCKYGVPISGNLSPQPHWVSCDNEKILLTISNCPNDASMVVLNNESYGGTAWGSYAVVYKNGYATNTVAHEFGHVFGKLNDEYSYGINASTKWTPQGVNCDADRACSKWSRIPSANCFEGCSYDNWFRPLLNETLMYDAKGNFGPVNEAELKRRLSNYK